MTAEARPMDDTGWAAIWGAIGLAVGGFITGLLAWLSQRGKSQSEIEIAALAQWKDISQGWADRLAAVEKELAEVRRQHANDIESLVKDHSEGMSALREHHSSEIEQMRRDHSTELEKIRRDHTKEVDEMRRQHRAEMKALRELNEGLQRQIAQNSQSTAYFLDKSGKGAPDGK